MKILLGTVYYEPAWAYGGPPKMVSDIARELARRGHRVTVCTTDALDGEQRIVHETEMLDGVHVVRFRNVSNWLAYHLKIFYPRSAKAWLEHHVADYDVLHLFEARTMLNGWAAEAANRHAIPYVLSAFGSLPIGEGWRAVVKRWYDHRYGRPQITDAAFVLAQNDHEAAVYRSCGAPIDRVIVWPLAVKPDEFRSLPERGSLRAMLGIRPDQPVVLFVGRIHALKGLDLLLEAWALATRQVPAARLVLVGRDDGYLGSVHQLVKTLRIASTVSIVDAMYGRDVLSAYVDCDLFCLTPTHFEETSLASLAACACGRPVLINNRCGIPWLEEYGAGIYAGLSATDVSNALISLISDSPRLEAMGRAAHRMVQERFTLPRIIDEIERIYERAGVTSREHTAT